MTFSMNFKIQCNRKLVLFLLLYPVSICAKGGGAGSGSSSGSGTYSSGGSSSGNRYYSSGWVFWYSDGTCGQYCIITFTIRDRLRMDLEQDIVELDNDDNPPRLTTHQTAIDKQYPPLSRARDNNGLPLYSEVSAAPEQSRLHGLRHEATWQAYKEGQKFVRENPPYEVLPPAEHIEYIVASGGPKAWEVVLEESIVNNNLASISDNGHVVQFHGKSDKIVQTNYPLFRPEEYDSDNETSPTSMTGLTHEQKALQSFSMESIQPLPPAYSVGSTLPRESHSEWFYYYEITILTNPKKKDSTIAIGLATKPYPPFRLPGWHKQSVGWHSDDGHKFHNESYGGKPYSEMWGDVGDVIGCGYYPKTGIVFFTKNGQKLENAFSGVRHIWFPTVGADNECKIGFNFGGGENEFRYEEARKTSVAGPIKASSNVSASSLGGGFYERDADYRREGKRTE